jgi:altronate hydrolase
VELRFMLYEIADPPTAGNSVILLHPRDNVAIARFALPADREVQAGGFQLFTRDPVPAGHKLALRHISKSESVFRYGNVIGFALQTIEAGEHVHVHNLGYQDLDLSSAEFGSDVQQVTAAPGKRTFLGFPRSDGRVGTRNYVAIVAASNCAAHTAEMIAASFANETLPVNVDGVVAFPHGEGCGMAIGPDTEQLQRTLQGVLDHPNVSAALILGLGCEVNQISHYLGRGDGNGYVPPVNLHGLTLQDSGGTAATVEAARQHVWRFIEQAASEKRQEVSAAHLVVGLNCGGSDSFSGITANPALGHCCDLVVEHGGTVVLAETTEIIGAEHLLLRRARSPQVARKLLAHIESYKAYLRQF